MRTLVPACLCATAFAGAPALAQDTQAPTALPEAMAAVPYGNVILLSGARSRDNVGGGKVTTYTWTRLSGEGGDFPINQPRQTSVPTFELPQPAGNPARPGLHRFQLQVTDTSGNVSLPAAIDVLVVDNLAPVAILGAPASIAYGAPLTLHGEHSADIAGRVVRWRFSRIQGPNGPAWPLNVTYTGMIGTIPVQAGTAHLAPGAHVFRLVVVDDAGNESAPRDVTVTVATGAAADMLAPNAVLDAPVTIGVGFPLTLSAARSVDHGGGQIRRYEWMRLSGAGGAGMPLNQSFVTQTETFRVPQPAGALLGLGRHRFRLAVEDTSGYVSLPVEREVIVGDIVPPTAALDAPGTLLPGEAFSLSGKRSTDVGGRIVKYAFTRIAGSSQGPLPLNQTMEVEGYLLNVPDSRANPYALGTHVFRLVVTDDSGNVSKPIDVKVGIVATR